SLTTLAPGCAPMHILQKFPERSQKSKLEGEKQLGKIRVIVVLKTFLMHYKLNVYILKVTSVDLWYLYLFVLMFYTIN
ncbi:hypothetical protein LGP00_24725, partial [Escherichia coli]|uniref:hypothetical protein n=1 Tax=Escherichia coli TaxID=562 RepID=UPI001CF4A8B3